MGGRYRERVHATAPRLASADDADDAALLAARAADDDGPLNDVVRVDLVAPRPGSATWLVPGGLAHVLRDTRRGGSWVLGVAAERSAWPALLPRVAAHVAAQGGGEITWWRASADDHDIAAAGAHGYTVARRQHELRVALPLTPAVRSTVRPDDGTVRLRAFRAGDVEGVLTVNNAAFAGHPEQGGWTRAIIEARMAQAWFDPSLFVVADTPRAGDPTSTAGNSHVVGFNWLKPHAASAHDVARGEIYTIAVDPAEHGRGLGRRLAIGGLDLLHERGFRCASLFVAADNESALALYASLGFVTHRTDVALVSSVAPA